MNVGAISQTARLDSGDFRFSKSQPIRILVRADADIRELMIEWLVRAGCVAEPVADAEAAVRALTFGSYDLLIIDQEMSKGSGLAFLKALRSARINIPALMLSRSMTPAFFDLFPRLAPVTALLKPCTITEFQASLENAIHQPVGSMAPVREARKLACGGNTPYRPRSFASKVRHD